MRKLIISIEGIDGAGKTTLMESLDGKSIHVFPLQDIVNVRIKGKWYFQPFNNAERFLQSVVGYGMSFFTPVILDRCFLSAYAYSKCNSKLTAFINRVFKFPELQPDILVFKTVNPQIATSRKQSEYVSEFLQCVYDEYLELLKQLQQSNRYRFVGRTNEELWYLRTDSPRKEVENEHKRIVERLQALREVFDETAHSNGRGE